jgi:TetR/AcrR family transcriptional repressor of nem operon
MSRTEVKTNAKDKLLQAAVSVVRSKGYSATTVDDLCAAAGVTKGAFFHHFKSKEELAVSAADHWSAVTSELFASAEYRKSADPLERVLGYIELRKQLLQGKTPEFTCLVGTMVQEAFDSSPKIREACKQSIFGHAAELAKDIELAKKLYAPKAQWNANSLALHTQAVIQGAFILAKANESSDVAADSIDHLRRYLDFLFQKNRT